MLKKKVSVLNRLSFFFRFFYFGKKKTMKEKKSKPKISFLEYVNTHILYLNSSKFFAGVIMILLNIGSKFITIQFSKSTEEYLKLSVSKQLMVFAMAWMGTRDIYAALVLCAVFVILSDYLFNEDSQCCIVPEKHRVLHKLAVAPSDKVSVLEINAAKATLDKALKESQMEEQKLALLKFSTGASSS